MMLIRVRKLFNIAIKHALSLQEQFVGEPLQRDNPCLFCINSDMSSSLQQAVNAWPFFHPSSLMVRGSSSLKQDIFEIVVSGLERLIDSIHTVLIDYSHRFCRCCRCQSSSSPIWSSVSLWPLFCPNVIIPDTPTVNTSPPVFLLRLVRAPASVA